MTQKLPKTGWARAWFHAAWVIALVFAFWWWGGLRLASTDRSLALVGFGAFVLPIVAVGRLNGMRSTNLCALGYFACLGFLLTGWVVPGDVELRLNGKTVEALVTDYECLKTKGSCTIYAHDLRLPDGTGLPGKLRLNDPRAEGTKVSVRIVDSGKLDPKLAASVKPDIFEALAVLLALVWVGLTALLTISGERLRREAIAGDTPH